MPDLPALPEIPLSTKERAPKIGPSANELTKVVCPHCAKEMFGVGKNARLANHIKFRHPDKWQGSAKKAAAAAKQAPKAAPTRTIADNLGNLSGQPVPRRRPAADTIASGISSIAGVIQWVDPPVGNALKFAAPAMGELVDDAAAGTVVDRKLLQGANVAKTKIEHFRGASLPFLILLMTHDQTIVRDAEGNFLAPGRMYFALEDHALDALEDALTCAVPRIKARAARQEKALLALEELKAIDPEIRESEDPMRTLLERIIFASPPTGPQPAPEEETTA
jgi:hypothetical protein